MELVLLLHISQYDKQLARFRSTSFERSGDGTGISVIDKECIDGTTGSICDHARAFYGKIVGEPPIFWVFDSAILPNGYSLDAVRSDTGDDCHRNIEGVSDHRAKKFFRRQPDSIFQICDGAESRPLTDEDIQREREKFEATLRE
jgi:hypothetical protein